LAEEYLKQKGVRVTMKDIEEELGASVEMRQKLSGAGLSGASIPVLDVGGTILVGFSTSAVDRVLERALRKYPWLTRRRPSCCRRAEFDRPSASGRRARARPSRDLAPCAPSPPPC